MNKQQLIDKAIDDLKGELPWGTNEACVLVYYPRPSSYAMSHPICIHSGAFEICTRREFEERKAERDALKGCVGVVEQARKELGLENTPIIKQWQLDVIDSKIAEIKAREQDDNWYDYENQKSLRLPPVGEVVEVFTDGNFKKAKVLEQTSNELDDVIVCRVLDRPINRFGNLGYFNTARPLDWNKRRAAAVNELTDLIKAEGVEGITAVSCADSILAAGCRKCDN